MTTATKTTAKKMKTYNFVFSEQKRTISRTYGGSNYTLNVYEIINGEPIKIGEAHACTRGHKGEESEAFGVIVKQRPEIIRKIETRCNRILKEPNHPHKYTAELFLKDVKNSGGYYFWQFRDLGINLRKV